MAPAPTEGESSFARLRRRRVVFSAAVTIPLLLSLGVHGAIGLFVRFARLVEQRPERLTDATGSESVLLLNTPEPAPKPPPTPPPEPPPAEVLPPEPEREPAPEPEAKPAGEPPPLPARPEMETPTPPAARPPAPTALRPTIFAGVKAERAEKIVYVVDASGAMTSSLAFVLEELSRSIARLDESQSFQVVLFRERPRDSPSPANTSGYEMFRPDLIAATPVNKDAARAWLTGIRPLGRSTPLPGLKAALQLKPDLVFLLTRSITRSGPNQEWGEGNGAVLAGLDKLNPVSPFTGKRRVVIKAIQFLDDDPSGLLQAIAADHGDGPGSYVIRRIGELRGEEKK